MSEIVTVNHLIKLLKEISEHGNGDMKVKCADGFLHKDEIGMDFRENEMRIQGHLFNVPITEKVKKFCSEVERAKQEFYGFLESEE